MSDTCIFANYRDIPPGYTGIAVVSGYVTCYFKNGLWHREDGPAMVFENGKKTWYIDGVVHREDAPAETWPDDSWAWYHHGDLHRIDGPAIRSSDGQLFWRLCGMNFSKKAYGRFLPRLLEACESNPSMSMKEVFRILIIQRGRVQ